MTVAKSIRKESETAEVYHHLSQPYSEWLPNPTALVSIAYLLKMSRWVEIDYPEDWESRVRLPVVYLEASYSRPRLYVRQALHYH